MKTIYFVLLITYIYGIKGIKSQFGMKITHQFEDNEKDHMNNNITTLDNTINEHNSLINKLKNQINKENTFLKEIYTENNEKVAIEESGRNELFNSIMSIIEKNRNKNIALQKTIDEIKQNSLIKFGNLKKSVEDNLELQKLINEGNYLKKQNNLMLKEINLIKKNNQISSLENSYFRKFNLKKLHWLFSDIKNNDPNSNSTKIKENEIEIEKQISILSQLKMIENNLIEQIKDIKEKIAQLEKQKDSNLV